MNKNLIEVNPTRYRGWYQAGIYVQNTSEVNVSGNKTGFDLILLENCNISASVEGTLEAIGRDVLLIFLSGGNILHNRKI